MLYAKGIDIEGACLLCNVYVFEFLWVADDDDDDASECVH